MKQHKKFLKMDDIKNKINNNITRDIESEIKNKIEKTQTTEMEIKNLLNSDDYVKIKIHSFGKFDSEKIIDQIGVGIDRENKKYILIAENNAVTKVIHMLEILKKKIRKNNFRHKILLMEPNEIGLIITLNN